MSQWELPTSGRVPVCRLDELPIGLGRAFRIGSRSIAIFRTRAGKVFALANRCPHKNGPLADGMIVGEQVVCPMHNFRFQADTGECDQPNVCAVAAYPVEVIDYRIELILPLADIATTDAVTSTVKG